MLKWRVEQRKKTGFGKNESGFGPSSETATAKKWESFSVAKVQQVEAETKSNTSPEENLDQALLNNDKFCQRGCISGRLPIVNVFAIPEAPLSSTDQRAFQFATRGRCIKGRLL